MISFRSLTNRDVRDVIELASSLQQSREGTEEQWHAARLLLVERLGQLDDQAVAELVALMWLGRGDAGDDFQELVRAALQASDEGDRSYIASKSPLRQYLEEGCRKAGISLP